MLIFSRLRIRFSASHRVWAFWSAVELGRIYRRNVYKYSYLDGQVQLLKGDAKHGVNNKQKGYIKDFFEQQSSILEVPASQVSSLYLFPNPANHSVSLFGIEGDVSYVIFNMKGQKVRMGRTQNNIISCLNTLSNGVFLIGFYTDNTCIAKRKLVIDML